MQPPALDRPRPTRGDPATVAMVLCAGLGTRLRPLTVERPKPLVPIGDRPLLQHIVARLARHGVGRVVINTHHAAEAFTVSELEALGLPTVALHEPAILGTAGGVHNARAQLGDGDVIVWNGDILAELDLAALSAAHRAAGATATLAVAPAARGAGNVGVDPAGRVVRLRSESFGREARGYDFVGVQILSAAFRSLLPAAGCLVGDALLPALRAGGWVQAAPVVAGWSDVGTIDAYLQANLDWLGARGVDSWLGPDASVGGEVALRRSVIGASATVAGQGEASECVVWPGAKLVAPLSRAVVTAAGVVVRASAR